MFIEMAPSNMLDLFSGIGGMSLAFHGIFKTVAYCEIDKQCQCILRANMHRGRIDTAPIFEDITKLQPNTSRNNTRFTSYPQDFHVKTYPHATGTPVVSMVRSRHCFITCCVWLLKYPNVKSSFSKTSRTSSTKGWKS